MFPFGFPDVGIQLPLTPSPSSGVVAPQLRPAVQLFLRLLTCICPSVFLLADSHQVTKVVLDQARAPEAAAEATFTVKTTMTISMVKLRPEWTKLQNRPRCTGQS